MFPLEIRQLIFVFFLTDECIWRQTRLRAFVSCFRVHDRQLFQDSYLVLCLRRIFLCEEETPLYSFLSYSNLSEALPGEKASQGIIHGPWKREKMTWRTNPFCPQGAFAKLSSP